MPLAGSFLFRTVMQDSDGELRASRWLLIVTAGAIHAFFKGTSSLWPLESCLRVPRSFQLPSTYNSNNTNEGPDTCLARAFTLTTIHSTYRVHLGCA